MYKFSIESPWCVVHERRDGEKVVVAANFSSKEGAGWFAAGLAAKNGNGEYLSVVNLNDGAE